jgi:hypothetical protein
MLAKRLQLDTTRKELLEAYFSATADATQHRSLAIV